MGMSISSDMSSDGRQVTIKIFGRFDFSQHQAFRQAYDKANNAVNTFIVDMSGTEYIDSSALGMLLLLRDKVGDKKESVKIVNARSEVKKILQIANFDRLFAVA